MLVLQTHVWLNIKDRKHKKLGLNAKSKFFEWFKEISEGQKQAEAELSTPNHVLNGNTLYIRHGLKTSHHFEEKCDMILHIVF